MLDTAHLNEVNIIDHKILRGMNCYSFIFGKKPASFFTGQSQNRQMFVSVSSWEVAVVVSCWGEEEAGAGKKQFGQIRLGMNGILGHFCVISECKRQQVSLEPSASLKSLPEEFAVNTQRSQPLLLNRTFTFDSDKKSLKSSGLISSIFQEKSFESTGEVYNSPLYIMIGYWFLGLYWLPSASRHSEFKNQAEAMAWLLFHYILDFAQLEQKYLKEKKKKKKQFKII